MCNIEGLKLLENTYLINVRKYRRANQEWTIQRNWHQWVHKTQDENKQNKNTTQKPKKMSNTDPTNNTTQKTKKMSNTDPTKNTTQKTKKMSNMDPTKNTTQKTKKMSNTAPPKTQHRKLKR
jgi:hypothetical protein